ncbi:YbaB/EbfC family nucleoid-associated protein [Micromonospora sp. DR5-3]|uniref:YbaB/EbfC family nucleoid-associated protein n=1 Tax=unclassified Micromonospora TaxID=2617518 RepID=UPI0011D86C7A|nr:MULTISPECIES: YbaB/EbfC family nucleoid-associated protein [unclassified Micromonospora]MCW3814477.1 YbaB/EbfC family nucleoid-associated protein [Micromonospora sp. DR5-3]TYC22695.1 YbaB/EbfC family nucleoid-associated protein [Micromonospora sp. MP36]
MAHPVDPSGLDRVLSETMSALGQFTAGAETDAPLPEGHGEAADGLVQVTVGPPGRITALTLNPRVMRLASESLAEEITQAVNAAFADLQEKATAAVPGQVDLGSLGDRLRKIQEDAGRQLTAFTDALVEAQDRLARQGGK